MRTAIEDDARANLRDSIIALFPSSQSPVTDDQITNRSENPTEQEAAPVIEEERAQEQPAASEIQIATSPDQLQNAFSQVPQSDVPLTAVSVTSELKSEEQPEAKNTIATTTINEFCSLVMLSRTVGYIGANRSQSQGEIMSAYIGTSSKKLASDWAELICLWGGRTSIRKPERLQDSAIKYEVKIWDLEIKRINFLASHHTDPSSPVPVFTSEFSKKPQKKSEENAGKLPSGSNETPLPTNSNLTVEESNEKPESSRVETQESKFYFMNAREYDPLVPEFYCYLKDGDKYVGKVRVSLSLTQQGRWVPDTLRGAEWQTVSFANQEEAAEDLLKRKQYAQAIHDKTNNEVRKMYGFDEIEKAETATVDAIKKDAIERIDDYMKQLGWTKKQASEFSVSRFGIDHRSKMDLLQLLELAEAMQEQLKQQPA